jgi:hypothetical protein
LLVAYAQLVMHILSKYAGSVAFTQLSVYSRDVTLSRWASLCVYAIVIKLAKWVCNLTYKDIGRLVARELLRFLGHRGRSNV